MREWLGGHVAASQGQHTTPAQPQDTTTGRSSGNSTVPLFMQNLDRMILTSVSDNIV